MKTNKVTRVEIIDHRKCKACTDKTRILCGACGGSGFNGRTVVAYSSDVSVDVQLQDDDRTLKIFISEMAK